MQIHFSYRGIQGITGHHLKPHTLAVLLERCGVFILLLRPRSPYQQSITTFVNVWTTRLHSSDCIVWVKCNADTLLLQEYRVTRYWRNTHWQLLESSQHLKKTKRLCSSVLFLAQAPALSVSVKYTTWHRLIVHQHDNSLTCCIVTREACSLCSVCKSSLP